MCAPTVDWITFSGLTFIVLIAIVLIAFLIIEFSKTVSIFTKDKSVRKDVIDNIIEHDEQLD